MAGNYRKATSSIANKSEEIKVKNDCCEPRLLNVSNMKVVSHAQYENRCSGNDLGLLGKEYDVVDNECNRNDIMTFEEKAA